MNSKNNHINKKSGLRHKGPQTTQLPDTRPLFDNRQLYIKAKCKTCGCTFVTKKINGFQNCRK